MRPVASGETEASAIAYGRFPPKLRYMTAPQLAEIAALVGDPARANILSTLFDGRDTRNLRTRQMQDVGGSPQRAYAEVIWTTLAPETTQPMRVVVFVEWVLDQDKTWRITRIRLLTP